MASIWGTGKVCHRGHGGPPWGPPLPHRCPAQLLGIRSSLGWSPNWCYFLWVSWVRRFRGSVNCCQRNQWMQIPVCSKVLNFWCASNWLSFSRLWCQIPTIWNSNSVSMGMRICILINPLSFLSEPCICQDRCEAFSANSRTWQAYFLLIARVFLTHSGVCVGT